MRPRVEYRLTPLGLEVGQQVEALEDWIETSLPHIMAARAELKTNQVSEAAGVHRIR